MNSARVLVRSEQWGQIAYHPNFDEFEAYSVNPAEELHVNRPLSAGCLVTGRCNLRCPHCYGNEEALPSTELSASEWAKIFAKLRTWGLMRVDISGGEPTTRRDLGDILKAAADEGLNVILSTNGLSRNWIPNGQTAADLRIHVSLDSGNPSVHAANRRSRSGKPSVGAFSTTSEFIAECMSRGSRVRVLTAVGMHNRDDLLWLAEHVAKLQVPEWNISRVLPAGRAKAQYHQVWALDDQIVSEIEDLHYAFPWMTIRYSNRTEQDGYFLLVLPDGSAATQFTDDRDKVILGSLESMTLAEIQNNPNFTLRQHASKWIARVLSNQGNDWFGTDYQIIVSA
jgi:organic radical activating enzyme